MRLDRPGQAIIDPDDYQLTFERTQGGTVGWTQRTARTLTQWSLENPFVTAYASVHIEPSDPAGKRARLADSCVPQATDQNAWTWASTIRRCLSAR